MLISLYLLKYYINNDLDDQYKSCSFFFLNIDISIPRRSQRMIKVIRTELSDWNLETSLQS